MTTTHTLDIAGGTLNYDVRGDGPLVMTPDPRRMARNTLARADAAS